MISIIVCVAQNGAIGNKGGLLYHLRADLRRFKALTTGNVVIMGRKTFESLPKGALPNRRNIVLTHSDSKYAGAESFPSLKKALDACSNQEHIYIIGGSSVYQEALPLADELCLTLVHAVPKEADTFFPIINPDEWQQTYREDHPKDEQNDEPFSFINLVRLPNKQ